jgi:hypothetical protein
MNGKRLVVLETASGRIIRTLVEFPPEPNHQYIEGPIAFTPDRTTVYYSTNSGEPGDIWLWRVQLGGSEPERLDNGAVYPAVSPDGRQLAFVGRNGLILRDIASSADREIRLPAGTAIGKRMAWASDSRRLALQVDGPYVSGQAPETGVRILDTSTHRSVADAEPVVVPPHPERRDATVGAWRAGSDELVVIRYCCWPEHDNDPMDLVAMRDGDVADVSAVGSVGSLDYDASGLYRLMTVLRGGPENVTAELQWDREGKRGVLGAWLAAAW